MPQETLLRRVMRHEGKVTHSGLHVAYKDSRGKTTIAYGTLIDFPGGLSEAEAMYLLQNRLDIATIEGETSFPGFHDLDPARQGVIVEMIFQMGITGVLGFHDMIAALQAADYDAAADAMLASVWGKETPSRAEEMTEIMRSGSA